MFSSILILLALPCVFLSSESCRFSLPQSAKPKLLFLHSEKLAVPYSSGRILRLLIHFSAPLSWVSRSCRLRLAADLPNFKVIAMVIKKAKAPTLGIEGETATHDKNEEIGSWDQQQENLEQQLADIPFEELQKARADGSYAIQLKPAYKLHDKPGRANKNRPMEMSSKVRVGRYREVIQAPKRGVRDPRFESLCGNLDTERFRNRYSFLYEDELPAEKSKLQKLIKKSKDPNVIEDLKNHISWIDKQLKSSLHKNIESEILSQHINKEKEAAKHGKHPYYLKKSEIRERKLIRKYNELKSSGKLDSFIEKRRKKNASKDHRFMPYRKSSVEGRS